MHSLGSKVEPNLDPKSALTGCATGSFNPNLPELVFPPCVNSVYFRAVEMQVWHCFSTGLPNALLFLRTSSFTGTANLRQVFHSTA